MIDYETLMNDKKLLHEQIDDLKAQNRAINILYKAAFDELVASYERIHNLTTEVMRLTEIVEAGL